MAPPPVQLFMTTIASQPALRQRQETLLRVLQVKKIQFDSYDLASDPEAKTLWRRKAPADKQQLPGILVGGEFPGTYAQFEEAVEYGELDMFLRRNEEFVPSEFDPPSPAVKPVGVPGAYSPNEMNPKHRSPSRSPGLSPPASPLAGKGRLVQMDEELSAFGIPDVDLTEDDLTALVAELGLGQADASDLVRGLSQSSKSSKTKPSIKVEKPSMDVQREAEESKVAVEALVVKRDIKTLEVTPAVEPRAKAPVVEVPEEVPELQLDKAPLMDDDIFGSHVNIGSVPEAEKQEAIEGVVPEKVEAKVEKTIAGFKAEELPETKVEAVTEVQVESSPVVEPTEEAPVVKAVVETVSEPKVPKLSREVREDPIRGRRGVPSAETEVNRELKAEEVLDEKSSSIAKTEVEDGEMYIPELKSELKSEEVSATSAATGKDMGE